MDRICYQKKKKYTKYKLEETISISIGLIPPGDVSRYKISLSKDGNLTIRERYTWDGPSGPTLDTKNFMRASLVHDALYQLMRLGDLDSDKFRKSADQVMRILCRQDGMNVFRAWYVYWAVRLFAKGAAKQHVEPIFVQYAP
ncbi:MAG: hypothetical protein A2Y90_02195 [Chloroflexi bacterium RBG_13_52_12]|nr:MAG: hypothetical protein A2Y90_02195 [Chloroflexi bacterium RBG_13_52_12]